MAKQDQGYSRSSRSSSGGWGRSRSTETVIREARKDELVDIYIRQAKRGILDVLGLHSGDPDYDDIAGVIEQDVRQDIADGKMTKKDIYKAAAEEQNSNRDALLQGYMAKQDVGKLQSASVLIDALYSASRIQERNDLDDGDMVDDPVSMLVDGGGWGQESPGRLRIHKHVNIAIDNSGSTHTEATGYCSQALERVANALIRVLYTAASAHPGVSYDGFSFNKIAECHTGILGKELRAEQVRQQLQQIEVDDPYVVNARETNLMPLIRRMHENEVRRGLIGQPRLDIILTDGEFESDEDAQAAAEWQRKRGPDVTTYVLNICPEDMEDRVALPHQFRVIPVECIEEPATEGRWYSRKTVNDDILRQVMTRIVVAEVASRQN